MASAIGSFWNNSSVAPTLNAATAPDGTTTVSLITTSGNPNSICANATGITAAGTYTVSVFTKQGSNPTMMLGITDNIANAAQALFNFSTHAFTTAAVGNASIVSTSYQPFRMAGTDCL